MVDGTLVEVRRGRYDGVTITDEIGHVTYNNLLAQQDPDTKAPLPNLIISSTLPEGKRGVPSKVIGDAMDEAVKRAFADSNLSEKEARQFKDVSELISTSLEKDQDFSERETQSIVSQLTKIAADKGGRN